MGFFPNRTPVPVESTQTFFVVKEIDTGQEKHEFEASLGCIGNCLAGLAGAAGQLTADSGIPVEMQSRKNRPIRLETGVEW